MYDDSIQPATVLVCVGKHYRKFKTHLIIFELLILERYKAIDVLCQFELGDSLPIRGCGFCFVESRCCKLGMIETRSKLALELCDHML